MRTYRVTYALGANRRTRLVDARNELEARRAFYREAHRNAVVIRIDIA